MVYINPSYGFINYSTIKNEASLNEMLSTKTDNFYYNKYNKRSDFMKYFRKNCIKTIYYDINNNNFYFPLESLSNDDFFSQFLKSIICGEVSNFFTNSLFLEKFYKNYAKIYYSKMASTVRNYTVESISLKSTIFPFETAFTDFMNQYIGFENAINEITFNVLYLCTKRFIDFNYYINEIDDCKDCYISVYDLFFRPNYVSKKLPKAISIDTKFEFNNVPPSIKVDDITYKALKYYIKHDAFDEIDLKECNVKASSLVYTVIKRSIRYVFVSQMKQAFGWFLDNNKEKYPEIKSIIYDTNLYYTQNITNIKQNIKYLKNVITFCDSMLNKKRRRESTMNKDIFIKSFTQYVKTIVDHMRSYDDVSMSIMNDLKKLYMTCFDKNQSQPLYNAEMYKMLKTISKYFCVKNETSLSNIQKYNFCDRWNDVINDDLIINPINYIEYRTVKEF